MLYDHIVSLKGVSCFNNESASKPLFLLCKKYRVFCDTFVILRVRGRFINPDLIYDTKFPILLPKRHHFVKLLIRKIHFEANRFGWSYVLSIIRQKFWIINGQSAVRFYLRECISFIKLNTCNV